MSGPLEQILDLLRRFEAENEDIQGSIVVSVQGLPICSSFSDDDSRQGILSAMIAAITSVADRATIELNRGKLRRVLVDGEDGLMIIMQAGPHSLLAVLVKDDKSLGLIFMLMSSLAKKIAEILD